MAQNKFVNLCIHFAIRSERHTELKSLELYTINGIKIRTNKIDS